MVVAETEAEEVIVEEVVVGDAEKAHSVDEGVEEGIRRETEMMVRESNLTDQ